MIMGGGFGRRFPGYSQIVDQIAQIAMQVPYPVKLIWSREQEVARRLPPAGCGTVARGHRQEAHGGLGVRLCAK